MPRKYSPEQRVAAFWLKVDRSGGSDACWPWMGCKNPAGYGEVRWLGPKQLAHRVAFTLSGGVLTAEKPHALHRCKQSRACCNPAHLYAGDNADNVADRMRDGTHVTSPGDRSGRHTKPERTARGSVQGLAKLKESDIPAILAACAAGERQRTIARRFGVRHSTIGCVARRTTWRHVLPLPPALEGAQ